ncbi:TonB-dependent receptor plug domain-containing protein [Escherichia coli]
MTQRDIPQSVTIVSQQRMEDQQLQTLGEVMKKALGISKSQATIVLFIIPADSRSITISSWYPHLF